MADKTATTAPACGTRSSTPSADTWLGPHDLHLFNEGTHYRLYDKLGAHAGIKDGQQGVYFHVWAPNAQRIALMGSFNDWSSESHLLESLGDSGIWGCFVPGVQRGESYKYQITSQHRGYVVDKADPMAMYSELPPATASRIWDLEYQWSDELWMKQRQQIDALSSPMSLYEVHLGSWLRSPDNPERFLSYRELAPKLASYCREMGFTHVELMPVMEHPYYPSWGYQATGYFAPSSRYGTPQDFMDFVDHLHQQGIGVILDWAPAHFPSDAHGLAFFDGTHLYEHEDQRQRIHPDWGSYVFNYGRNEVRSFLISAAMFWLDKYHIDGLRVDAVASMLYLDYSREAGQWIANEHGGRENLEAIEFLRRLNAAAYEHHPGVQMIAEESTSWPMVSRPVYVGGLGFGFKWDMGWMHDTLSYMSHDPVHRSYHHNQLTFRQIYAFSENFILPLSHDEVVHGKGSLLSRMPGDDWQKFANLRLLLTYMWTQPGKKLLFMGGEIGQWQEWRFEHSLDWHLLQQPQHEGVRQLVAQLNRLLVHEPALHELDAIGSGFEWIDGSDAMNSVLAYLRKSRSPRDTLLVVCNFTPMVRSEYAVGVPTAGRWVELFNSDADIYGGSGQGNLGHAQTIASPAHGREQQLRLTLPPLSVVIFKHEAAP